MKVGMTEQQARSVAAAARVGLRLMNEGAAARLDPSDMDQAFKGAEILERAVRVSVGIEQAEPAEDEG